MASIYLHLTAKIIQGTTACIQLGQQEQHCRIKEHGQLGLGNIEKVHHDNYIMDVFITIFDIIMMLHAN